MQHGSVPKTFQRHSVRSRPSELTLQIGGRCGAISTRPIEGGEQRRLNRNGASSAAPDARGIFRRAAPAPRMRLYRNPPDCRLQRDDKPAACTTFSSPVAAGATWASAQKTPACHSERVDDSTLLTVHHQRRVSPPTETLHWRPAATYFERHTRSRRSRGK
jgi:hypothetical protein